MIEKKEEIIMRKYKLPGTYSIYTDKKNKKEYIYIVIIANKLMWRSEKQVFAKTWPIIVYVYVLNDNETPPD